MRKENRINHANNFKYELKMVKNKTALNACGTVTRGSIFSKADRNGQTMNPVQNLVISRG